jgi:hypothetical protein
LREREVGWERYFKEKEKVNVAQLTVHIIQGLLVVGPLAFTQNITEMTEAFLFYFLRGWLKG